MADPADTLDRPRLFVVLGLAIALLTALLLAGPFVREPTRDTEFLLPAYAAAAFVLEAVTAVLLFALYHVQRSPALLILACGYLFAALMIPGWVLSFPGVFSALGVEFGLQATASIAALRRLVFALCVLGYALAPVQAPARWSGGPTITRSVTGVIVLASAALWFITHSDTLLPAFMRDARDVNLLWLYVPGAAMLLYLTSMILLLSRRRTALDLWMCLVLFSLVIELVLISYIGGAARLSVGWWAGRIYGLAATGIVLVALLSDTTTVHARLAQSVAAERRARQNRLTAMEALSASIAHEINQPLASMITNADAGLRWLSRPEPQADKVEAALRRIVADGHRANKIVAGIRTMFMKGAQDREPVDLNALIRDAMAAAAPEARLAGVTMEAALDARPRMIVGNAVQLRQVVSNLVDNAIDAMRGPGIRPRELVLRSRRAANGDVEVAVEDTGSGLEPGLEERIFEPFVSTKSGGMGMGLMFCRAVIEAHGGSLRASPNRPRGTIFRFTLPEAEPAA